MNLNRGEKIAEAVLYEGYMLYPYRASAVKNRQRWNFGVLCPRIYAESQNASEAWSMQTECLVRGDQTTVLRAKVRFLQVINRSIARLPHLLRELPDSGKFEFEVVDRLEVVGQTFVPWQEAVEREIVVQSPRQAVESPRAPLTFEFPGGRQFESLRDERGLIEGVIIREWESVSGSVEIDSRQCLSDVIKVAVSVHNLTSYDPQNQSRGAALMYSLVSAHTLLIVENGRFISLLDPPESLRSLAEGCRNIGTWPVLVGDEGDQDTMLSSPIILYDYPQIAPESSGGLFDGTEIDEILSLRILTMTEEEKREMRQTDQRIRQILERTESMPPEQFMKLHGVLRGLHPLTEEAL
jgi:hypothetical protein